jgi:type 1 fimbria pilin
MQKISAKKIRVLGFMCSVLWSASVLAGTSEMVFNGDLVAEPCSLDPNDAAIAVDFDTIINKDIYRNTRTAGKVFQIHLINCDTSLAKSVALNFSGAESVKVPGMLAVDASSQSSGIVVGFETTQGTPLPLNKNTAEYMLADGMNVLTFNAFVQGEPDAIAGKNIVPGGFSATAEFVMDYQ